MHTLAGERIQISRQGRNQGFTFTGFHLGDASFMQRHATHHLHIKMPHAHNALAGFTDQGKGFRKNGIKALTLRNTLLVLGGFGLQLFVTQGVQFLFLGIDADHNLAHALQLTLVLATKQFFQ